MSLLNEPLRAPVKDFSISGALLQELHRRIIGGKERQRRARKTSEGQLPCSTCARTISTNKLQCLVCRNMTEFFLLAISRSEKTNPEAEARIEELQDLLAHDPLALINFAASLLTSYPQATYGDVRDSVFALLFSGTISAIDYDQIRADNEGMAHA